MASQAGRTTRTAKRHERKATNDTSAGSPHHLQTPIARTKRPALGKFCAYFFLPDHMATIIGQTLPGPTKSYRNGSALDQRPPIGYHYRKALTTPLPVFRARFHVRRHASALAIASLPQLGNVTPPRPVSHKSTIGIHRQTTMDTSPASAQQRAFFRIHVFRLPRTQQTNAPATYTRVPKNSLAHRVFHGQNNTQAEDI